VGGTVQDLKHLQGGGRPQELKPVSVMDWGALSLSLLLFCRDYNLYGAPGGDTNKWNRVPVVPVEGSGGKQRGLQKTYASKNLEQPATETIRQIPNGGRWLD